MRQLKILYVGPDYPGSNGTCWRDAFVELGHQVRTIPTNHFVPSPIKLFDRVRQKRLGGPPLGRLKRFNEAILREVREFKPSFTFYVKAQYVFPDTLKQSRQAAPNLAYFNDDMFNLKNQDPSFYQSIRQIDCIFTTKSYNVPEFHTAKAPLALFIPNAYDPKIHYPAKPSAEEYEKYRGDVAFIGTFRPERADFLAHLALYRNEFLFNIWGGGWEKMGRPLYWKRWGEWRNLRACVRGKELWCAQMGKAIQSNKICLGLLYRANRDQHTSRSFEIPACGGFLLAERTEEHRLYFEEDTEAVYFNSLEELLDKIRYYLTHEKDRLQIAQAGYRRCLRSAYRYADRAQFAIEKYGRLPLQRGTAIT